LTFTGVQQVFGRRADPVHRKSRRSSTPTWLRHDSLAGSNSVPAREASAEEGVDECRAAWKQCRLLAGDPTGGTTEAG